MPLDNEFVTIYDDDKEKLKVNLEDLKRHKERQQAKASVKFLKKQAARKLAKTRGLKLGRWQGNYARIKGTNGWFHMPTMTVCDERPGPIPE